ncbi:MAG: S8 family serine peptidase [Pseudomonadota bacterium]
MKRHMNSTLRAAALAASALMASAAFGQTSVPVEAAEGGRLWFVELSGSPVADGSSLSAVRSEKAAFRRAAAAAGVRFTERRSYDTLFNGFSIELNPGDRAKVMALGGVKAMYPVERVQAPSPEQAAGSAPDLVAAINLTGASIAQTRGLTGKGIKVGIIDTGIDIDHPAFGGGGVPGGTAFPSTRVVAGYDFVGDAYNSSGAGAALNPVPDANPDDCAGHGSHVAGIVGANGGGLKGVAPEVSLGAYRVFGCTGTTDSDIIVEALERAYADGMHIINQSLGAGRQWPQYPTAQATSRLVNKGVVMVASIGNNGPGGSSPDALFAAGAPGVGDKVIGVASFDNAQRAFTVAGTPYGYNAATGSPQAPGTGSLPMSRTGATAPTVEGCPPYDAAIFPGVASWVGGAWLAQGSQTGNAVLIRRGTCGFIAKAYNAQQAGAAAVVLYNNAAGALAPTVAGPVAITIPVVAITQAQGITLSGLIGTGPTTLTWTNNYVGYPFGTGGLISGFSSFGMTAELGFKPNIGAPGGAIFSAYPLELGGTATLSGTSMSSPHVAGGAALILEARPKFKAQGLMARLQNTADPKNWSGSAGLGLLDHSFRQGAGMLDIVGTIDATTVVEPSQIAAGESAAGPKTTTITVKNEGNSAVTYALSHVAGVASGPNTQTGASYNISNVYDAPATVAFSAASVAVAPGASATFDVTITANSSLPDRSLYGGYLVLTPQGGGDPLRVPYAGFKGDYQSTVVLTPTANGFPWLAQLSGTTFFNRPNGGTFTLIGNDIPFFLLHLDHMSRRVRLEAFDAVSGKSWYRVSEDEYVTRSATPGGFFQFTWDGDTFAGKGKNGSQQYTVPNGQYVVKVSVLKALGDESNPAHWETWTSPVVTIARP